jgi:hypothetical protein
MHIDNWSPYPVEKTEFGLRITAYIANTPLHLIIDTGASHSFLFSDRLPADTVFAGCRVIESKLSDSDCKVTKISVVDDKGKFREDLAMVTTALTPQGLDFDGLLGVVSPPPRNFPKSA